MTEGWICTNAVVVGIMGYKPWKLNQSNCGIIVQLIKVFDPGG